MGAPRGNGQGHAVFGNLFLFQLATKMPHATGESGDVVGTEAAMETEHAKSKKRNALPRGGKSGKVGEMGARARVEIYGRCPSHRSALTTRTLPV